MTGVAAVVPNRDGAGLVGRAVAAALAAGADEVVVVDDGSRDGSDAEAERAGARVLRSPGTGFAAAVNAGVRATAAEHVLVLNSDCFVERATVSRLAEALLAHPRVGLCGAALVREDGSRASTYGPLLGAGLAVRVALGLPPPPPRDGRGVTRVPFVPLACAIARRRAWEEVGGLDERFPFYFEDHDLCRRLAAAGWWTAVRWDATAVHVEGGSSRASDPQRWFRRYVESRALYLRLHHPRGRWLAGAVWLPVSVAHAAVWLLRGGADGRRWAGAWLGGAAAGLRPARRGRH